MDSSELRRRLADASVAVLSTSDADGSPHSVPVCFAFDGDFLYFAVDHKPKRTTQLKRLHNIAANPSVALLIDRYEQYRERPPAGPVVAIKVERISGWSAT